MSDNSDKIELKQIDWQTKITQWMKFFTNILMQRLHNKAKYKAQRKLLS